MALAIAALTSAFVLLGVGLPDRPPPNPDIAEGLVQEFLWTEMAWARWWLWALLSLVVVFAVLLVIGPRLPGIEGYEHLAVAGATIGLVGRLADLAQDRMIEIASFSLANDLAPDFTAANVATMAIDRVGLWVDTGAFVVLAAGLAVIARRTMPSRWGTLSAALALALLAAAVAPFLPGDVYDPITLFTAVIGMLWAASHAVSPHIP